MTESRTDRYLLHREGGGPWAARGPVPRGNASSEGECPTPRREHRARPALVPGSVPQSFGGFSGRWERVRRTRARRAGVVLLTRTLSRRLLNNNQIKSIPGGSFEDLENLKYL